MKWKDQIIFAGEDVECTITFKNVAEKEINKNDGTAHGRRPSRPSTANAASSEPPRLSLKTPQSFFSHHSRRSYPFNSNRSHRVSSSVSSPFGAPPHSFPPAQGPPAPRSWQPNHKHKRSVSILSIDNDATNGKVPGSALFSRQRPGRGHLRSATMQIMPKRNEAYEKGLLKGILHDLVECEEIWI